jgi:hypothetical protein
MPPPDVRAEVKEPRLEVEDEEKNVGKKCWNVFKNIDQYFQKCFENVDQSMLEKCWVQCFLINVGETLFKKICSTFYEECWFNILFEKCCNISLKKCSNIS